MEGINYKRLTINYKLKMEAEPFGLMFDACGGGKDSRRVQEMLRHLSVESSRGREFFGIIREVYTVVLFLYFLATDKHG